MKFIRNWKISLPVAGVVLAGLAWLAFGYFGVQTAFIDDEVSEAAPVFDAPAEPADPANLPADEAPEADAADSDTDDVTGPTDATTDAEAEADTPVEAESVEPVDGDAVTDDAATTDAAEPATTDAAEPATTEAPVETAPVEPQIVTEASGSFAGTSSYDVSGEALVLGNGTGQRFLRFENFESDNGPDLNVYLFNPDDSSDFIDLGDLSGNIGEQNYEIPVDVDLDRYSEVSIWCVRFGVGFGTADLVTA